MDSVFLNSAHLFWRYCRVSGLCREHIGNLPRDLHFAEPRMLDHLMLKLADVVDNVLDDLDLGQLTVLGRLRDDML